jgi:HAD superfamily hydrolase (TIGR01509 family)
MHHYCHWIFDLDGTLTVPQHNFEEIRLELGVPPGTLILEYLEQLEASHAHGIRVRLNALESALANEARIADGAREVLEILQRRGADIGILTRNTRQNAYNALESIGLASFFDTAHVLGREEHTPKPAPDGIHHLLEQWRGQLAQTVMVGDFHLDLEAGRNAGVGTVHVAPSSAPRWPHLTDHRFNSLEELAALLATGA